MKSILRGLATRGAARLIALPLLALPPVARSVLALLVLALPLLALCATPAVAQAQGAAGASRSARIEGTISVTITGTRVKHWGVPGVDAVFVPDADRSAYAERIRSAASAQALCQALSAADGHDGRIASGSADGDANLDHRSGDEEILRFVVTVPPLRPAMRGGLYVCSPPVFAMMSRGTYPSERFYQIGAGPRLWWKGYRLSLRPGESVPVHLTTSVDASGW